MNEILSQEEIDALIRAATNPRADEAQEEAPKAPESERYDFRRPNKFSKEHFRALQRIYEQFCRTYSGLMSAKLRTKVDLRISSIEQITFGEFTRSLPNPSVLSILDVVPLNGPMVIQLSPDIAFLLHDRLCGGPGRLVERTSALTDIEVAILKRQVISVLMKMMGDAWHDFVQLSFKLDELESNPQFLQVAGDRDVCALISLSYELNTVKDMMNICIPFRTIEPSMKDLSQHKLFDSLKQPDPERTQQLKDRVRTAIIPIEVELGCTTVTVQDLLDLEVGDVIPLDRGRHENLDVKLGSLTKFKGTPGKLGSKLGVVITSIVEPEGDIEDE